MDRLRGEADGESPDGEVRDGEGPAGEGPNGAVTSMLSTFRERFGDAEGVVVARAPGRVNLIGDHTDYNEGFVLPTTIDRGIYAAARPRSDDAVAVHSENFGEDLRFSLGERPITRPGSWQSYIIGVVEELRLRAKLRRGFEAVLRGDVPLGAGLSSSAALEMATVRVLEVLFELRLDPIDAIRIGQTVEHRYAGVECGIMDQFVSRLGRRGHALLLDCRTLDHEHVPLPDPSDLTLIVADSRVKRELAASKYGERRSECREAVERIRSKYPAVAHLRDVDPDMLEACRTILDDTLYRRTLHVVGENRRVLLAADALRDGAFERFGELMNRSHESLRDLYEVSVRELDVLVEAAWSCSGVIGARMTGGGFGGCAIVLAPAAKVDDVRTALASAYSKAFEREPAFYVVADNFETEIVGTY